MPLLAPRETADAVVTQALARTVLRRQQRARDAALSFEDWCGQHFGYDLWPIQVEIADAVEAAAAAGGGMIAVKGCHGSGKSFVGGPITLRWLASAPDACAILTGPKFEQVRDNLFGYVRKAAEADPASWPAPTDHEIALSKNNFARVINTNQGVRMQGYHGRLLILVDEAAGVLPSVFQALSGMQAGGVVVIVLFLNPTISSGPAYDAFTVNRGLWTTFTIDATETPNLVGLGPDAESRLAKLRTARGDEDWLFDDVRPELVQRRWVWARIREWGEDSPLFVSRVRGQFPSQPVDAVFALSWLEWGRLAEAIDTGRKNLVAGLDVAGPGDNETVLRIMDGGATLKTYAWSKADPRGEVLIALGEWGDRIAGVNVDGSGMGYHFATFLRDKGYRVNSIRGEQAARDDATFLNLRAELYWKVREAARTGALSGLDETTIKQLLSIRYELRGGRIAIESKEKMRARGAASPDYADSLVYAQARAISGTGQRPRSYAAPQPFSLPPGRDRQIAARGGRVKVNR